MAPPRIHMALFALLMLSHIGSALQVTPNSPCARQCNDSPELDLSDPNSSNTKNKDIVCDDAKLPQDGKWRTCMSCLQNSTFSQGQESDQMWFLYNMRYSLAYCVFAYPNATDAGSTPCSTSMACGPLQNVFAHGILNQKGMTAYSYCAAHGQEGMHAQNYERCVSCVGAEGKTEFLSNYVTALLAGCQQQPEPGKILGLSDSVFTNHPIAIVDPLTLIKGPEPGPGLPSSTLAGIAAGVLVVILAIAATVFICYRKRKNRKARASWEANPHSRFRHRHKSSISFQCQTHAMSPRHWPGSETPELVDNNMIDTNKPAHLPTDLSRRSSLWKPHNSISSFENTLEPTKEESAWDVRDEKADIFVTPLPRNEKTITPKKAAASTVTPLHNITTSIPTIPPQARASPFSATYNSPSDIRTPMSAESTRSTTALLPGIRPYVPAEHGVHGTYHSPASQATNVFASPVSGNTASPLLRSYGWADQRPAPQQSQPQPQPPRSRLSTASSLGIGVAISIPPPPPKIPKLSMPVPTKRKNNNNNNNNNNNSSNIPPGTPVDSWEIQTAFAGPPASSKR